MDSIAARATTNASAFSTSTANPQIAVVYAMAELENLLEKFLATGDVADRMLLLTKVEDLRRYVLVRSALVKGLQKPARADGSSLGKALCDTLRLIIGDVPKLVKTNSLQGARNMERDTRRAIASLTFIGSLDPSFV
ncbi:hypothetical protein [Aestuariivirga sp.]|uniref:hypothetical protein n=1 Tax=Aestuariivirga sp. TaxID=2650926 RepID=UPI003BAC63AF